MSYYATKSISIKKDGKIFVTCADSSIHPLSFFRSEYKGTLAELIKSINDGNFHLYKSSCNEKFIKLDEFLDVLNKRMDENGLTWDECFKYRHLELRYAPILWVCDEIERNWPDSVFLYTKEFIESFDKKVLDSLSVLDEVTHSFQGIITVRTAGYSIFEGYDFLITHDGRHILAPTEDYENGFLKTDPDKVIDLGNEANDLWSYLTYSGLNLTFSQIIEKLSKSEEDKLICKDKLDRVKNTVKQLVSKGLTLKAKPYLDFAI